MAPALALAAVALLAACATPRERCILAAEANLRAIDAQIADHETALARGYRVIPATEPRTILRICAWPREPVLFCTEHTPGQRETRVSVDAEVEEARLAQLRKERARMVVQTADRIAACPA